jgi:hypothetical protein
MYVEEISIKCLRISLMNLGLVVHAYNPSTWEAEAGGSQV